MTRMSKEELHAFVQLLHARANNITPPPGCVISDALEEIVENTIGGLGDLAELLKASDRTAARRAAGVHHNSMPVVFEASHRGTPKVVGDKGGYYTATGRRIWHPNAYRRKAKSVRLHKTPSTERVVVGPDWVLRQLGVSVRLEDQQ